MAAVGADIVVITSKPCAFDVTMDGCYLP